MGICLIYMTAGSEDEAERIGRDLVASRLAACVNIIPGMKSVYRWKGTLQEDRETVLIAKSSSERLSQLTERVKTLHSYDCPCVVSLPVAGGNQDFIDWIGAATTEDPGEA
jgi:periplasmic divalent cation tolerance protein